MFSTLKTTYCMLTFNVFALRKVMFMKKFYKGLINTAVIAVMVFAFNIVAFAQGTTSISVSKNNIGVGDSVTVSVTTSAPISATVSVSSTVSVLVSIGILLKAQASGLMYII